MKSYTENLKGKKIALQILIFVCLMWLLGSFSFALLTTNIPIVRMSFGVVLLWIVCGGGLMYYYREFLRVQVQRIALGRRTVFVISATVLALIEESITTTMTNLAPLLGSNIGETYITASTNYLDVVLFHSVIMFIPFFVGLAYVYDRYQLSPIGTFWLFGILGLLLEVVYGGVSALGNAVFWIFVYGLMVYIPAYSLYIPNNTQSLPWWRYPIAFCLTIIIAVPQVVILFLIITQVLGHPLIHF